MRTTSRIAVAIVVVAALAAVWVGLQDRRGIAVPAGWADLADFPTVAHHDTWEHVDRALLTAPLATAGGLATWGWLTGAPVDVGSIDLAHPPPAPGSRLSDLDAVVYVVDSAVDRRYDDEHGDTLPLARRWSIDRTETNDCRNHGTAVASALAASYERQRPSNDATLVSVDAVGCEASGFRPLPLWAATNWIIGVHDPDVPGIVNVSIDARDRNTSMGEALQHLSDHGLTVVVSAGNRSVDVCTDTWLGGVADDVVIVGSSQPASVQPVASSNRGECVTAWRRGASVETPALGPGVRRSGTSFAAPSFAGELLARPPGERVVADVGE